MLRKKAKDININISDAIQIGHTVTIVLYIVHSDIRTKSVTSCATVCQCVFKTCPDVLVAIQIETCDRSIVCNHVAECKFVIITVTTSTHKNTVLNFAIRRSSVDRSAAVGFR